MLPLIGHRYDDPKTAKKHQIYWSITSLHNCSYAVTKEQLCVACTTEAGHEKALGCDVVSVSSKPA